VYLSFETIKKIKFGKVLIKGCRVVCGYDCVWVWKLSMYIYIIKRHHILGGRGVYHSINISKKLENIINDNLKVINSNNNYQ
jgi:hypothetical protein